MTLLIDDDDRYSRLRLIAWWDQARLAAARVLVVGAGALGNEVLKNLALVGVGTIFVVDCDTVERTNLARSVLFRASHCGRPKVEVAAAALRELNPDCRVVPLHGNVLTDVGLGLFRHCDLTIGCLDNREARLWVNRACWKVGRPWIDGGIQEINGVCKVFVPPDSACYECAMTERDYQLINLRYSCPLLSREDLLAGKVPTAPTIASLIGAMQVQEALKLLHGLPVEAGSAFVFNGVSNRSYSTKLPFRPDCLSHETLPPPLPLPLSARRNTAADLFAALPGSPDAGPWELRLDRDLVVSFDCVCGHNEPVLRPVFQVRQSAATCPACGETRSAQRTAAVYSASPLAQQTLATLGVPPFDIVRVVSAAGEQFVLLDGDAEALPAPAGVACAP